MNDEELAYGGFLEVSDEIRNQFDKNHTPFDVVIAAKNAIILAEHDLENDVFRHLVYGGPMAPWTTTDSIKMRKLSISVQATALCEVFPYICTFTDVYNSITAHKMMPWATFSRTKGFVVDVCRGHIIAPNFDNLICWKNEYS